MTLLYSLFCQYFSRGCFLKCCLDQEKWYVLVIAFLVGVIVGSPFQGHMSDKIGRRKVLLITISSVIFSLLIIVFSPSFFPKESFPILLAIASIINGVFGNVFPAAAAAYSEQINDFQKSLKISTLCRYLALALPFLLQLPHLYGFLAALILNLISLVIIAANFKDRTPTTD